MNIVSHLSSPEDYNFIKKFSYQFSKENIVCIFVTTNIYMWLLLKMKREKVYIIKMQNFNKKIEGSFNEKVNYLDNPYIVGDMYYSTMCWCNDFIKKNKVDLIFIPSGRLITQKALKDFAEKAKIRTIFIGYGNIPGKTILDPLGTDKQSSLYKDCTILDNVNISDKDYRRWYEEYYKEKIKRNTIPQARKINFEFIFKRLLRTCISKIDNLIKIVHDIDYKFYQIPWKSLNIFNKNVIVHNNTDVKDIKSNYVFFAMQLSNDTQIIQNYEYDIYTALDEAIKLAKNRNIQLVVKGHPAEVDLKVDLHLSQLEKRGDIILSNSNTFELIEGSDLVIVVNSTVGLEAKILDKEVIFLGDSFFKKLTKEQIKSYVLDYLYDIDYFSTEKINDETYLKIKKRLLG
ncbi:capsular polysaccharide export protein, LipB/KpsS family [Photobacterium leiognathi]|uniref:capsular polysaccharide export protein, LipB/KpsS family n=1 Tax=Photobacterium leiognathi TaxID=553611 RepID=UPI0029812B7D|nr:hypothetical protein [Photobacterium leiognathi]